MSTISSKWLLIFTFLFASLTAFAQPMKGLFGSAPREFLLVNPKVQKELKLSAAQIKAINDAVGDSVSQQGGATRISIGPGTDLEQIITDLKKVPNGEQSKRLTELWIQKTGPTCLGNKDMAEKVGLSESQQKQVKGILEDMSEELQSLVMSSGGRVGPEKTTPLKDAANKKILALMNDKQRKAFEGLKGKPFEF